MIQRIQTIYFIAIIIICATLCTGSVIKTMETLPTGGTGEYNLNLFYYTALENGALTASKVQFELIAIVAIIIGLTVTVIFSFKDRMKQKKLAKVNYIIMLVLALAVFTKAVILFPTFSFSKIFPYSSFGLMLICFLFYLNWRAIRLIKKDEELVRSADRIR
jgi:hypothetical protein